MSTVVIEKYVDGICVEEMQLPAAPLRFLAGLLPAGAKRQLFGQGLDIEALLNEDSRSAGVQWMDVQEKQVAKRIRISRRD